MWKPTHLEDGVRHTGEGTCGVLSDLENVHSPGVEVTFKKLK